jgi:formylglycine-generating enzyme required for sulfatase activity
MGRSNFRRLMTFVSFRNALDFAELRGLRLPTEAEYEFAATAGGTREFPWGDDADRIVEWQYGPVGSISYDRTESNWPLHGLYSNVAEWTDSPPVPYPAAFQPKMPAAMHRMLVQGRVVRGGPFSVALGAPDVGEWHRGPRWRHGMNQNTTYRGLGFRCARSVKPRFLD